MNELYAYLMKCIDAIPPKTLLGMAVSCTLNQWPKLLTYLEDDRLDISNNLSERAIKPFVMGRKAWLFSHSVEDAHAGANIFSIIETCKYHGIDPYDYLRCVLNALPNCQTLDDYEKLLPGQISIKTDQRNHYLPQRDYWCSLDTFLPSIYSIRGLNEVKFLSSNKDN